MSGPDPRSRTKEVVFTLVIAGGSLEGVGMVPHEPLPK